MEVLLAEEYGFCNGVKRALAKLDEALEARPEGGVCSIGEIIHNAEVVERYRELGVRTVESVWDVAGGVGVVRAHGLPSSVIEEARAAGVRIVDATCPYVRLISAIIKRELGTDASIYLVGEPGHPEVIASTADFGGRVTVIDHAAFDPATFPWPTGDAVLLSQTTMAEEAFIRIAGAFIAHCPRVTVCNTICQSTRVRQSSALEVAAKVEAMVVIGGKKSSNTRRLAELCAAIVPTVQAESAAELDPAFFRGMRKVGVTAGASTPDRLVDEAVARLHSL